MEKITLILTSIFVMMALAAVLGFGLSFAYRKLKIEEDEQLKKILAALPGLNCGGCGFASCEEVAKRILEGACPLDICKVGGEKAKKDLEALVGKRESTKRDTMKARLKCNAKSSQKTKTADYYGLKTCLAAGVLGTSGFACFDGCLGFGDCVGACPVFAITMVEGRPEVSLEKCVGCGRCVTACPCKLFDLVPLKEENKELVAVGCNCTQKGVVTARMCKGGCIACGKCVKTCPVNAISLGNNKLASINPTVCTDCGKCIEACPTKAIYKWKI